MDVLSFIERLREKPTHVRERIAFFTSVGITGVIGAVWLMALVASNPFSQNTLIAERALEDGAQLRDAFSETGTQFENLMGAVGAVSGSSNTEAGGDVRVVPGDMQSISESPTVIPF